MITENDLIKNGYYHYPAGGPGSPLEPPVKCYWRKFFNGYEVWVTSYFNGTFKADMKVMDADCEVTITLTRFTQASSIESIEEVMYRHWLAS